MKIPCPSCAKLLTVSDEAAGRRIRCPHCKEVFEAPPIAVAPVQEHVQAEPPEPRLAPPPLPRESVQVRRSAAADEEGGRCFLDIRRDDVGLNRAVEQRLRKLLATERLDFEIMDEEEPLPEEIGRDDLVIAGKVVNSDYGSQMMRYWLTFITIFGPGSCQLELDVDVETAEGTERVRANLRQAIGIFGGAGETLMKQNVKMASLKIADGAIRHFTGRKLLNAQVYAMAYWSLGLGLASLVPFIGPILGIIALILGVVALVKISQRRLPRGKGPALTGIITPFVGFVVTGVVFWLLLHY